MAPSNLALVEAKAAWRSHAMFRAMSQDYLLREQFSTDPMQIFSDYVLGGDHDGVDAEAANQLVFAVFSSPSLRQWLGNYAVELAGRSPGRHQFAGRFAGAAANARDEVVTLALMRGAASGEGVFSAQVDFFRSLLSTMGQVDGEGGVGVGPVTESRGGGLDLAGRLAEEIRSAVKVNAQLSRMGAGTEQSPGGTEMSPGATGGGLIPGLISILKRAELFSLQLQRAAGTEMSPGTATEMSPGVATDKSPGVQSFSERLVAEVRTAMRFATGLLSSQGTEMSPGTGTEMSPGAGTGTEMSPGTATEMSPGGFVLTDALTASLRRAELFSDALLRGQGTEMSPGTATEMSPGIGTEHSLGAISNRLAAELTIVGRYLAELSRLQAGTEMSPGGGTEMSPGGTEMSPGALSLGQALIEALRGAERLGMQLARASEGTEMTPSTTTDMSPGIATDKSPGDLNLAWRMVDEIRVILRVAGGLIRADGTEMSPGVTGRSPGTEKSPGGTEMSPGTKGRSPGTEKSPGGTEMSPGPGALVFAQFEELKVGLARVQRTLGQIRLADGTEMSPGTGTEMSPGGGGTEVSPGTGTEMSPGAFGGQWGRLDLPTHVVATLNALVQYAGFVRGRGALRVSGLEF